MPSKPGLFHGEIALPAKQRPRSPASRCENRLRAYNAWMQSRPTIQVKDLCRALDVPPREARYVLERGYVPEGVEESPQSGNYRRFDAVQAMWLAVVLLMKKSGVQPDVAAKVADFTLSILHHLRMPGGDPDFSPVDGRLVTTWEHIIEVADARYARYASDSALGRQRRHVSSPWVLLDHPGKRLPEDRRLCVVVQLSLGEIGRRLAKVFPAE